MSRYAPPGTESAPPTDIERDLQLLRERLVAEGLHGAPLAEALEAARRVAAEPGRAERRLAALRDPAALAERIRAISPRPYGFWVGLGCFVLGVPLGPSLATTALGNLWPSYPPISRWWAGAAALALLLLLLAVASRYAQSGLLGALAGLGGGLAQSMMVALPWLAIASLQPSCTHAGACSVAPWVGLIYGGVTLLLYAVPLIFVLAGLCSTAAFWVQERRYKAVIRRTW